VLQVDTFTAERYSPHQMMQYISKVQAPINKLCSQVGCGLRLQERLGPVGRRQSSNPSKVYRQEWAKQKGFNALTLPCRQVSAAFCRLLSSCCCCCCCWA
jgi:hypothetical protein